MALGEAAMKAEAEKAGIHQNKKTETHCCVSV